MNAAIARSRDNRASLWKSRLGRAAAVAKNIPPLGITRHTSRMIRFASALVLALVLLPVAAEAQLDQWLRFEMDRWGKVIRDNKITLE